MSIVSPKTGRLIKINSKAYSDLLKDSKYKDALFNTSLHSVPKSTVSPSGTPPFHNLSPLNLSPLSSLPKAPKISLPPLTRSVSKSLVQPPPSAALSPVFTPPSPSASLKNIPMPLLPSLPRPSPNALPVLNIPIRTSPSLMMSGKMQKSLPISNQNQDELAEILSMPFSNIPTLEETLKNTDQPSKRAKLEKMIREKRETEGRGIKSRGWDARAPIKGKERQQLQAECGDKCFLLPSVQKFPICASPRMNGGQSKCEIDCGGVQSALIRARQWGYDEVAQKAEIILKECNKDRNNFLPKSQESPVFPSSESPVFPFQESPQMLPSAQLAGAMHRRVARRTSRRTAERTRDIELSPSMSRYGSPSKKKAPDCGCGN